MTGLPPPGCTCDPAWPALVVHTAIGDVSVAAAATSGALACLYSAVCAGCGATYPGPFRVPAATRRGANAALASEVSAPGAGRPGREGD